MSGGPPASAKTQRATLLRMLIDAKGAWVPSPAIAAQAQQYNARLHELRKLGFCIENRVETDPETGERHSWFRLLSSGAGPKPAELDSPYMRRARHEHDQAAPLFAGVQS